MKAFRNIHFKTRDYETSNIVACVAETAPNANYEEAQDEILEGLTKLYVERNVVCYGHL